VLWHDGVVEKPGGFLMMSRLTFFNVWCSELVMEVRT
jgi:hypothetical protein